MIFNNTMKTLLNIGYIIWYKLHNAWLHMIDVELWIPMNLMTTPNTIDENDDLVNDYIDSWYEVDSNDGTSTNQKDDKHITIEDQIDSNKTNRNYKPYDGPYCETP